VTAVVADIAFTDTTAETPGTRTLTFPRGLLGFEDNRTFRIERDPAWEPFARLRSLEEPRLSFVIAPPRVFVPDYTVRIDPMEIAELRARDAADTELWVILTVPEDPRRMSANLQGPVVINRRNGLGKQLVLTRSQYPTRFMVLGEEPVAETEPAISV
jgi:flagellar assembly factor FliW